MRKLTIKPLAENTLETNSRDRHVDAPQNQTSTAASSKRLGFQDLYQRAVQDTALLVDRLKFGSGLWRRTNAFTRSAVPVDASFLGALDNAIEFGPSPLRTLQGRLPTSIAGAALRNGPGTLERDNQRLPSLLDGNGAVLKVQFMAGEATATLRHIQTEGFRKDAESNRFEAPIFRYLPEGSLAKRSVLRAHNPANINLLSTRDRLLALYEGGRPYALDPSTLQTISEVDLGGLSASMTFTSHPKRDPNGRTFGFGVDLAPTGGLFIYELDEDGMLAAKRKQTFNSMAIHDMFSVGDHLILIEPPVELAMPQTLLGLRSTADSISWNRRGQSVIHVIDKDTLEEVARAECPPFLSAHYGSSKVLEDGRLAVLAFLPDTPDPAANELSQLLHGQGVKVGGRPTRLVIDPRSGALCESTTLSTISAEWPVTHPGGGTDCWCATQTEGAGYFNGLMWLDHQGVKGRFNFPDGHYANEPTVIPDADDPNRTWLMATVYNSRAHRSEIWLFDAHDLSLDSAPIYKAALPQVVPLEFHGIFSAA